MKKCLLILIILSLKQLAFAQETGLQQRGVIRVQKKGQLAKIQFDDVNYRLVGIDVYGNVLDTAVLEFQMSVTIKGIFYSETTVGPNLTYQMQQLLGRRDQSSLLFFDKIKVKDRSGNIFDMPKFQFKMGYANENNN